VRAGADRPGDLGRAAAAFEEALLLRPDDHDADVALDRVRAELTRRRARKSRSSMDARPTLDRLVVGLASEQTWGLFALLASLLFALGLVLRRRPKGTLTSRQRARADGRRRAGSPSSRSRSERASCVAPRAPESSSSTRCTSRTKRENRGEATPSRGRRRRSGRTSRRSRARPLGRCLGLDPAGERSF